MKTMKIRISKLAAILGVLSAGQAYAAQSPTVEELQEQVDALAAAIEEINNNPAASQSKTTIGGYGEHHFNNLDEQNDQIDAHRYVLFVNHKYSDDLKFFSELEIEHGFVADTDTDTNSLEKDIDESPGEVELEQAYIEKTFSNDMRLKIGQFLIPVGFLNETHEPDTFYGVERNAFEKNIIPTTWWETGLMLSGDYKRVSYDVAFHSGLKTVTVANDDTQIASLRSGRQKSAKAEANGAAVTARIKHSPVSGVELAGTYQYQEDLSQGLEFGVDASLLSVQASWQINNFSSKFVYAFWDVNDIVEGNGITVPDGGQGYSEQEGFTAEVSYKPLKDLGVFTRFSSWDKAAADEDESAVEQFDLGVNYWLNERVVVKGDYQMQTKKSDDSEVNGINLGLGWSF